MAYPFPVSLLPASGEEWADVQVTQVPIHDIVYCQYVVRIDRLLALELGGVPEGADWPHVVLWRGGYYLHDGHHRYVVARFRGQKFFACRVARIGA